MEKVRYQPEELARLRKSFSMLALAAWVTAVAAEPGLAGCSADPKSVVTHGGARFTVMSSRAVEIESPPFDDRCESHTHHMCTCLFG